MNEFWFGVALDHESQTVIFLTCGDQEEESRREAETLAEGKPWELFNLVDFEEVKRMAQWMHSQGLHENQVRRLMAELVQEIGKLSD